MSNPQNILGKYRSYAYHHILLVCNNTATADLLGDSTDITVYQHPTDPLMRYKARDLFRDKEHQYITLIDGTTDARFYITGATWESVIAMQDYIGDGNIPQSTSMSLEGELSVMEPLGANFLNVLAKSCDQLGSDPVGLIFVLKTIFVGHNDNGTSDMLSTVKPLLFMNYDITAIFDSSGAKYTMSFVGITNGLGKMPQVQQSVSGFSYKIDPNKTLQKTFDDISLEIDKSYETFKAKAQADYAKNLYVSSQEGGGTAINATTAIVDSKAFFKENYRPVKYKIYADDYKADKYKAGDNDNIRTANTLDDGSYNFGTNVGIETIIKKVLASSNGIIEDGKQDAEGKRYIYKIVSGLNSSTSTFMVEYHIKRYEMLMQPFNAAFKGEPYVPEDGQFIEFNYIFTGKNVDVKEFDIKMEMGMAFFQIAATTETVPTQKTIKTGIVSESFAGPGATPPASDNKVKRDKTPLFLGSKLKAPMARNTKNPVNSASFQALLNRHAALESVEAKMTIFGNPQLLNEMQIQSKDLAKDGIEDPKKDKTINPKWMSVPTLVKVNVKMPVDANDVNSEYIDFWYTGYYTLFAVKHIFEGGEFLQELDMLSMPVADELENISDSKKEKPKKPTEEELKAQKKADEAIFKKIDKAFEVKATKNAEDQTVGQAKAQYERSNDYK